MSNPNNPLDLFPSPDPSGDFGRDEGLTGYAIVAMKDPDVPIKEAADLAARIAMIATGRYDVNPHRASEAIVERLTSDLPDIGEVVDDEGEK